MSNDNAWMMENLFLKWFYKMFGLPVRQPREIQKKGSIVTYICNVYFSDNLSALSDEIMNNVLPKNTVALLQLWNNSYVLLSQKLIKICKYSYNLEDKL